MATDYAEYARQKAAGFEEFKRELDGDSQPNGYNVHREVFDLLHEARGYIMSMHSGFPLGIEPSDADIEEMTAKLNAWVGEPFPQVK